MAVIGNSSTQQAFTPAIDYFSGTGSATAFTLSRPVASVAQVQVTIDNVAQNPSSAYTVSGNTITFTSAPLSGTNNIYVYYTSPITQVIAPGQGTVNTASLNTSSLAIPPANVSDQTNTSTGYFGLPIGTTAQRPASPGTGMIRYNTTESKYEVYTSAGWAFLGSTIYTYDIDYLVAAGGGASGNLSSFSGGLVGGGGGAGGLLSGTTAITLNSVYTVTVGAGGTGTAGAGGNGTNSSFTGLTTAVGGGGGGGVGAAGVAGGSGGGAGGHTLLPASSGGAGTSGQGNAGGGSVANNRYGGSGGGAGGAGVVANGSGTGLALGGAGTASSITGSSVTYSTGGSSGYDNNAGGANTGNGGDTLNTGASANGSSGGSGVIILSIPTARYSGTTTGSPTVTTSGSNTILKFTSSGTYTA